MRPVLTANALARMILALVFGFMSLAHGPVMTFAKASSPSAVHDLASGPPSSHHHHAAPQALGELDDEQLVPRPHQGPATCYSAGCFVAVASIPIRAPTTHLCVLERMRAAPPDALVSVIIDPLVPPPRLHA